MVRAFDVTVAVVLLVSAGIVMGLWSQDASEWIALSALVTGAAVLWWRSREGLLRLVWLPAAVTTALIVGVVVADALVPLDLDESGAARWWEAANLLRKAAAGASVGFFALTLHEWLQRRNATRAEIIGATVLATLGGVAAAWVENLWYF